MAAAKSGVRPLLVAAAGNGVGESPGEDGEGLLSTDMSPDVVCARLLAGKQLHSRPNSRAAVAAAVGARMVPAAEWLRCRMRRCLC
jgi:hypothetical protein